METPPLAQSFEHNGRTYTLQPVALNGKNIDRINSAVQRSRVKKVREAMEVLEAMECTDEESRSLQVRMMTAAMRPMERFEPLDRRDLVRVLVCDPEVIAECLLFMCPEIEGRMSAQELVGNIGDIYDLGGLILQASGLLTVGNSQESQEPADETKKPSGGGDPRKKGKS